MTAITATGAAVEVAVDVPLTRAELWPRITDVERYGDWSPECVGTAWATPGQSPTVGARFTGINQFSTGLRLQVSCMITVCTPPAQFGWVVLDDAEDVDRPGSIWNYTLDEGRPGHTVLVHRFEQGPGLTGLQQVADDRQAVDRRLQQIHRNMSAALRAMIGDYYLEEIR
jgi:hypothetical protein